jgi:NAD(P)-dependent dehydrogenase (short-subunit alcohol dehydrogenase family)
MTFALDLNGRTALVTGGGQGVGRAVCHAFAAAGAAVIVNDFVADRAASVADAIVAAGGTAVACPFDVSDYAAVVHALESASVVDILVNNAGNAGPTTAAGASVSMGDFAESEPGDWDRYFAVNLYGVMHCTRAVLPRMIERGDGRVITIVSDAARWGEPRMTAYAAAKAGAAGFTRALAREVGRHGITVNNIALGTVDTIGLKAAAEGSAEVSDRLDRQLRRYIIRRLGEPEDVAGMVTFLASPLASWITGQTYPVNGGYTVNQ